jgi:hypothetical protein
MPVDRREEDLMRAAFAPARSLEPSDPEIARVLARAAARPWRPFDSNDGIRWKRLAAPALAALALLGAGLYAVPATRAAIEGVAEDVADAFAGYGNGNSADAPGRPLGSGEQAPDYFYDHDFAKDPRVIAEAGGYKLYAYIGPSGGINFDLGDTGVGMGFGGVNEIDAGALYVLGPGSMQHADPQGHVPLFGLSADSVERVELVYESGPPLDVEGIDGGFVLLAEPGRGPKELVAYDAEGKVVGQKSVAYIGWGQYDAPAGSER